LVLLNFGLETMVLTVNSEKIVLGNMLVKEIKTAPEKQQRTFMRSLSAFIK
jgi:hypothetical protein